VWFFGLNPGEGTQHSLNLWWDGDQFADRLNRVAVVAKHPVKAKSFLAGRLTPECE